MKRTFTFTQDDIKQGEAKLKQERPELFKRKKVTGNTRNAFLREMLQTTAKVTEASIPVPKIEPADQRQLPVPAKPKLTVPTIQKVEEPQRPVPAKPRIEF